MDIDELSERAKSRLRDEEGCRLKPYADMKGLLTIGYGWCLDRSPMREIEAEFRLTNDVNQAMLDCIRYIPEFANMGLDRQSAFVDLVFQMGMHGVAGFRRMMAAVRAGDWEGAARELLDSKYAREDAPARAERNAELFRKGGL